MASLTVLEHDELGSPDIGTKGVLSQQLGSWRVPEGTYISVRRNEEEFKDEQSERLSQYGIQKRQRF